MHFLLYSRINETTIRRSLGAPEYSYYFLLKEFRPVFERLGTVTVVTEPAEADVHHEAALVRGEGCVLVAFTAPQNLPAGLRCPVVPLFAWEFERIPDEAWGGNPQNDWRSVLGACGRAITLSGHAVQAVRAAMGADFPVVAVPVPIWERMHAARALCERPRDATLSLRVDGAVLNTADYDVDAQSMLNRNPLQCFESRVWDGTPRVLDFSLHAGGEGALIGFYLAEPWGAWSRNAEVAIALPWMLHGDVSVELELRAYGSNQGRPLLVGLGGGYQVFQLGPGSETRVFRFALAEPSHLLQIRGMQTRHPADGTEERTLGVGLSRVRVWRTPGAQQAVPGDGETGFATVVECRAGAPGEVLLRGFWGADDWGAWSCSEAPWIQLPRPVSGRVAVEIELMGHGPNAGATLTVYLGAQVRSLVPGPALAPQRLEFDLGEPAQVLGFTGVRPTGTGDARDPRALGIGLRRVVLTELGERPAAAQHDAKAHVRHVVRLDGIVFTSVLNPCDDRKNWLLLVSAFCFAFADADDATLVLKMTHHSQQRYLFDFHALLQRLPPFRCRIVMLHGYLEGEDYERLIARTDYYVNVSKAEGLCIPLMEFMICGKPALAPRHTSMLDYLDESNSIGIAAGTEPCIWPHDERGVLRTLQYRVAWDATVEALRRSRRLFLEEPQRYRDMGSAAARTMQAYCGFDHVRSRLEFFFGLAATAGVPERPAQEGAAP
jgi:glycosyltransferase involved in cell wall biosynthesis